MKHLKSNRGSAMLLGLGTMFLLGLLLAALLPWITAEINFSRVERDAVEARYAAEAGGKRAIAELTKSTPDWSLFSAGNRSFVDGDNSKYYNVILTTTTGTPITAPPGSTGIYLIRSTGTVGSVSRVTTINIDVTASGRIGMYIAGNLDLKQNITIDKDTVVRVGGKVTAKESPLPANLKDESPLAAPFNLVTTGYVTPLTSFNSGTSNKYVSGTLTDKDINYTLTGTDQNVGIYITGDIGTEADKNDANNITFSVGNKDNRNTMVVYIDGNVYAKNTFTIEGAIVIVTGSFMSEFNNLTANGLLIVDDSKSVTANNLNTKNNPSIKYETNATKYLASSGLGLTLDPIYTSGSSANVTAFNNWAKGK